MDNVGSMQLLLHRALVQILVTLHNPTWLQLWLHMGTALLYGLCSLYHPHENCLGAKWQ